MTPGSRRGSSTRRSRSAAALGLAVLSTLATSRTTHLVGIGNGRRGGADARLPRRVRRRRSAASPRASSCVALFVRARDVALINTGEAPRTGRMTATTPRVLRADAERNLRRVLDAAREVFAEHGIDAPVAAIAERAGVGVGDDLPSLPDEGRPARGAARPPGRAARRGGRRGTRARRPRSRRSASSPS